MKKRFAFLAVALLALVSCSKQDIFEAEPGMGNVNFTIAAPGEVTRAYIGDGENVNIVYYEIYLAQNNHKNSVNGGEPLIEGTVPMTAKEAQLSLNLLEDQNYVGLFWAQVDGKNFYDVKDLRSVSAIYTDAQNGNILSNNEDRAAFCQALPFNTENGGSQTVELVRPFAQLNLGTTEASLHIDYDIDLLESKMVVTGVAQTFNTAKMKAGSEAVSVVFDFAAVPDQMLEVNNVAYAYAGMNYFFAPADEGSVDVVYDIKTDVGTVNRVVSNVPVKTNYRTNILGNLLTNETVIEIIVDEEFKKPDIIAEIVSTTKQLEAAEAGSTIWLADNATIALPAKMASDITIIGGEGSVLTTPEIVKMENFTIQNVKFVQVDESHKYGAFRYIGSGTLENCEFEGECGIYQGNSQAYQTGDIVLRNCKFKAAWAYAVNTSGTGDVYIEDCEIYGWNSFGNKGKVVIKGTKFFHNGLYGKLRFYQEAEVTNCTFGDGMSIDFYNPSNGSLDGVEIKFTNCKMTDGSGIEGIVDMNCFNTSSPVFTIDGVQI